jgi:hypothetical protein
MVTAIQSIGTVDNVRRFRDLNAGLLEQYRGEFPGHVRAVSRTFDARLGNVRQHPGSGRDRPQTGAQQTDPAGGATLSPASPHAPRDAKFWSQDPYTVPGSKPSEVEYWIKHYLPQCSDRLDVNALEMDNASRIAELPAATKQEIQRAIAARRQELPPL